MNATYFAEAVNWYQTCKKNYQQNSICGGMENTRLKEEFESARQDMEDIFNAAVLKVITDREHDKELLR